MTKLKKMFFSFIVLLFVGNIYSSQAETLKQVPNDWYSSQTERDLDSSSVPTYEWMCKYKNEKNRYFSATKKTQTSAKSYALQNCKNAGSHQCNFVSCVRLCANCLEE